MITKKELEEQTTILQDEIIAHKNIIADYRQENRDLKNSKEDIERTKSWFLTECNVRAEFIEKILLILQRETKSISKFEVIRDMFLPQLKEIGDVKESYIGVKAHHKGVFLSDKISEDMRSIF